eukprot:SAG11_NODE_1155_length_5660_cov_6.290955_5_plen_68_part_00
MSGHARTAAAAAVTATGGLLIGTLGSIGMTSYAGVLLLLTSRQWTYHYHHETRTARYAQRSEVLSLA